MGLFEKSKKLYEGKLARANSMEKLKKLIGEKKIVLVPLKEGVDIEDELKAATGGAKTLFISEDEVKAGEECIVTGKNADYNVYIGKSY